MIGGRNVGFMRVNTLQDLGFKVWLKVLLGFRSRFIGLSVGIVSLVAELLAPT